MRFLKISNELRILIILLSCCATNCFCEELKPFQWEKILNTPPISDELGYQVLHFKSKNKPYVLDKLAVDFVDKYLKNAKELESDSAVLQYSLNAATLEGVYIELGVCTGKTINFIAALKPTQIIYGFDSFEGLPEDWQKGGKVISKGTFAYKQKDFVPPVLNNVKLYNGLFRDSLPVFVKMKIKDAPIAFLHIDSDIYSSAHEALEIFKNNIIPGTVIVFDEFYNYPNFEEHEYKAFHEFLRSAKLDAEYIAYNKNHEQVAIRIIKHQ